MNEFDIKTSYGMLHVYQKGAGRKTIILLHGSGCDNAMLSWHEVMQSFSGEYTVHRIFLDRRQAENYGQNRE